jgi:hypothetical protein
METMESWWLGLLLVEEELPHAAAVRANARAPIVDLLLRISLPTDLPCALPNFRLSV